MIQGATTAKSARQSESCIALFPAPQARRRKTRGGTVIRRSYSGAEALDQQERVYTTDGDLATYELGLTTALLVGPFQRSTIRPTSLWRGWRSGATSGPIACGQAAAPASHRMHNLGFNLMPLWSKDQQEFCPNEQLLKVYRLPLRIVILLHDTLSHTRCLIVPAHQPYLLRLRIGFLPSKSNAG